MKKFPETNQSLVVRTDFSDAPAWERFREEIMKPSDGFDINLHIVDDRAYDGLSVDDIAGLLPEQHELVLFIADKETLANEEFPVLALDLVDEPFASFRAVCREAGAIADCVQVDTIDFFQFAESVDEDGVFRGFQKTAQPPAEVPSAALYIGNLPFNATDELLTQSFSSAGRVVSAKVAKDDHGRMRGFARVEMVDTAAATRVKENWNGRELEGRAIIVAFDGPQWPR